MDADHPPRGSFFHTDPHLRGDCPLETVLSDVLGLTKINFNSCLHNDRLPVTIRFANAVGDVLLSAPMDSEPKLPFKFYI